MRSDQTTIPRFVVIDDDPINNLICRKNIQNLFPGADINAFTDPQAGLSYIESRHDTPGIHHTILFLDINMPVLTGWEVLDKLSCLPEATKKHFHIYLLSSSIAIEDKRRADDRKMVVGFLTKPLTPAVLQNCVDTMNLKT